jgi:hypothetical protein
VLIGDFVPVQHVYLGILYGLLALKSVFLDDFMAYFSGSIGPYVVCSSKFVSGVFDALNNKILRVLVCTKLFLRDVNLKNCSFALTVSSHYLIVSL